MTIEEAIKHCEEVAKEQDKLATRYEDASGYSRSHIESLKTNESIKCRECAKEHRQLAEWLSTFNTESATECFTAVQQLKEKVNE